jgi:hypothetical protein
MLIADRKELWPKLEAMGEEEIRKKLAADGFSAHEEEEVQEWLKCQVSLNAVTEARKAAKSASSSNIAAWVAAIAAAVAAFAAIVDVMKNWGLPK